MPEGNPPHWAIKFHFKRQLDKYEKSNQNSVALNYYILNKIQSITIIVSVLFILFILGFKVYRKKLSNKIILMLIVVAISLLTNSFICGSLSAPMGRYQGRIIWLIPFLLLILLNEQIEIIIRKRKGNTDQ